jgi:hypothetical protein
VPYSLFLETLVFPSKSSLLINVVATEVLPFEGPSNYILFFIKDEQLASNLTSAAAKEKLYHQISSAAESGWDFSSRWMRLDV